MTATPPAPPTPLTAAQRAALRHVRTRATAGHGAALARIEAAVGGAVETADLVARIRDHVRVTLNFHPDRFVAGGPTVAESLALDGRYRSQYETGLSNGSRTAHPGGARDGWEERLFGGAYHADGGARPGERPKYGALNLYGHPDGASPRFGSCHVRLRPEVNARVTYCHGDSHLGPVDVGTIDTFGRVLAGVLAEDADIARLPYPAVAVTAAVTAAEPGRKLDAYVEAQVHGDIDLVTDAEALVVDPSFRGTDTGRLLAATARRCGIALEWHAGFVLAPDEVGAEFRGAMMVPFAAWVCRSYARTGILDAEVLGRAAASVVRDPAAWARWGTRDEVLQYVKQLWHVLVRFGRTDGRTDGRTGERTGERTGGVNRRAAPER
ncbi:DUF3626 domain-containing protein [Streptomyces sp. NBC_01508]|uniref:DUF3626 domain-containing protein n=1 Tax=Streptomyces sp. NBC_01508 TaxID=2903888 RepID=UPI00386FEAF7